MNDDKYTEKGFFRRLFEMFQGLRMPRDTREYKLARIELQRLSAPLTAIVVPTLFGIVLCVVTAISSQRTELPPVDIAPIEDDPIDLTPPDEPETPEDIVPPEEIEITVDAPTVEPISNLPPAPIQTRSTDISVKPAPMDAEEDDGEDIADIFGDGSAFDFDDMGGDLSIDAMGDEEFTELPGDSFE